MKRRSHNGFTLLEVVAVLVIGGIVVALLAPFMGAALTRSHEPVDNLRDAVGLSSQMAVVVAEYREAFPWICEELREWEIQTIEGLDDLDDHYAMPLIEKDLCRFDDAGYLDCGGMECDEECESSICVLEVRLTSTLNPGEFLRYYFPVSIPPEDDEPGETDINDPEGCSDPAGPNCKELADGWICIEYAGASGICKVWIPE